MHNVVLILFLLFLNNSLMGQIRMEILVPVGISSYTPASLDRINEAIGSNNFTYQSGISTGLNWRFSFEFNQNFALQFGLLYKRMQVRAVESLSRESYSWTFRKTRIRTAEHHLGGGINFRYTFLHFPNSKLSAQLSTNLLKPIANEGWIKQERRSYYNEETEYYEYYQSEEYKNYLNDYLNAGLGVVYSLGKGPFKWIFETGYDFSYFEHEYRERSEITAADWNNFFIGAGVSLSIVKSDSEENIQDQ